MASAARWSIYSISTELRLKTRMHRWSVLVCCVTLNLSRGLWAESCLDVSHQGKQRRAHGFGATFTMSSSTFLLIHHPRLLSPSNWIHGFEKHFRWCKLFLWWCGHESLCRCITENAVSIDFVLNRAARSLFFFFPRDWGDIQCVTGTWISEIRRMNMSLARTSC